jgi:hypothetical protein
MTQFAERTGVSSERAPERYLWTDAFAVCNFLGLHRATGDERHKALALTLVEQVHRTLGRHRADDARAGWLSGLDEPQGEDHPARGGLRIGKRLPERLPGEPLDERLEWDRDGQYFHYLTKWMHALDQVSRATGRPSFNAWARELAQAAHGAFTYMPPGGGRKRMYWKMSIDLSRPLVTSMGQHDPLDGFVTYAELEATAATLPGSISGPHVGDEARDFASMIDLSSLATADPLGIGGLLTDAYRVDELLQRGEGASGDALLKGLLTAGLVGLQHYARLGDLESPPSRRLAFRELGLAIGLAAAARLCERAQSGPPRPGESPEVRALLEEIEPYAAIRAEIEAFWLRPEHRQTPLWLEHRNINDVMLATSLEPEGFLARSRTSGRR